MEIFLIFFCEFREDKWGYGVLGYFDQQRAILQRFK